MKIRDLREVTPGTTLQADICIIGAGPAGLTLASELASTHKRILVLESGGGKGEDAFAASLNAIESTGMPRVMDQARVRNRAVGGSSLTWSGRCAPLDSIDYQPRAWVPLSGWPFPEGEITPFLRRANHYLGLQTVDYNDPRLPRRSVIEGSDALRPVFWQFSRSSRWNPDYVRFGRQAHQLRARNVELLTNATAIELLPNADGHTIESVRVSTPERRLSTIQSRLVVLAAGGIENARLLLCSRAASPQGIGNSCDMVGRLLMDHPRATLGTFAVNAQHAIRKEFGLFQHSPSVTMQRGLAFTSAYQREHKLLNAAAWVTQHVDEDDAWRALRMASLRGPGHSRRAALLRALRHSDQILVGAWSKVTRRELPRRMGRLDLDAMVEQVPDLSSRVTLSERVDALGMPVSSVHWRINMAERCTLIELAHSINEALTRAGLPQAMLVDWVKHRRPEEGIFIDTAHPIGSTRMSATPATGVVDSTSRVHEVDNLYIAGSSVFPTAGHANPTLMIVALSIRLADLLRNRP